MGPANCYHEFGNCRLDTVKRCVIRDGHTIRLPSKAFDTLLVLVQNYGQTVSKDDLLSKVWPNSIVEENNLGQHIATIRKALGESSKDARFIMTVPGEGYRFVAPVKLCESSSLAAPLATLFPRTGSASSQPVTDRSRQAVHGHEVLRGKAQRISSAYFWAPAALFSVILIGVAVVRSRVDAGGRPEAVVSAPIKLRESVAVFGFENLSNQSDSAWLSTALSEMLTTEIAEGGRFRTIPGESVARAKVELNVAPLNGLSKTTLSRVQQNLGADMVVTGAYTLIDSPGHHSDRIRMDLRIQDAKSGETLAVSATTGTVRDLFSLVSRAGADLRNAAGDSRVPMPSAQARASLPSNPEAVRLYAEGLAQLRSFNAVAARDLLQRAVAKESSFALAHACLAQAWGILGYNQNALDEAKTAFDLSANLGLEEHLSIEGNYLQAAAQWDKASAVYGDLFHRYADNVDYGLRLAEVQRLGAHGRESLKTLAELKALPLPLRADPRIELEEAQTEQFLADYHAAEAAATRAVRQARERGPQFLLARALESLSEIDFYLGSPIPAKDAADQARQICEQINDPSCSAQAYIALGKSQAFVSPSNSILYRRQAVRIASQHGLDGQAATALNDLGSSLFSAGQLTEAEYDYSQASALFAKTNDKLGLLKTTINRGNIFFRTGKLHDAERLYRQGVELSGAAGQRHYYFLSVGNLASVEQLEGDLRDAMQDYQKSLQAARDMDMDPELPLANIGDLLYTEGDFAAARSTLEQSLAPKRAQGKDFFGLAEVDLAQLKLDDGDPVAAESLARHAAAGAVQAKDADYEARASEVLARALLAQSRTPEALQAIDYAASLLQPPFEDDAALQIAITASRISSANAHYSGAAVRNALNRLRGIIRTLDVQGDMNVRFDAVLAKAQIELSSGETSAARLELTTLRQEARRKNFGLAERRAEILLAGLRDDPKTKRR